MTYYFCWIWRRASRRIFHREEWTALCTLFYLICFWWVLLSTCFYLFCLFSSDLSMKFYSIFPHSCTKNPLLDIASNIHSFILVWFQLRIVIRLEHHSIPFLIKYFSSLSFYLSMSCTIFMFSLASFFH